MKFCKNISKEKQETLLAQLMDYENNLQMTEEERKSLHAWVAEGKSPYDNGDYIYREDGSLMDFISAIRFTDEQIRHFRNLTAGEKNKILKELKQDNISIDVFLQSI